MAGDGGGILTLLPTSLNDIQEDTDKCYHIKQSFTQTSFHKKGFRSSVYIEDISAAL